MTPEEMQERIQQLYTIPLRKLSQENVQELESLEDDLVRLGYEETEDSSIYAIRWIPKQA